MASLSLSLLGSFQALLDGQPVGTFRTNKAQALLVYLAVERERAHRRETLYTLLWPGMPEPSARHNLRQVLYHLRKMFPTLTASDTLSAGSSPSSTHREGEKNPTEDLLLADRQAVQMNPDAAVIVDSHRFDALLAEVQRHDHSSREGCAICREALEEAVDLYRGDFLADFYLDDSNEFEDWAQAIRESYRGKILGALENLAGIYLVIKNYDSTIETAKHQLGIDPLREQAHRDLMEALARSGRRPAALAHYETFHKQLQDELETIPSQETQKLAAAIRKGELEPIQETLAVLPSSHTSPSPPQPAADQPIENITERSIRHNLPAQPTPFIGRETELAFLDKLLADSGIRLATIVGPGGMGKTRLALACAERLLEHRGGSETHPSFSDGVFFIDLASLAESWQIPLAVADVLQIHLDGGNNLPQQQLLDFLEDKEMLFILDNFEHLLAGTGLVSALLSAAPGVQILVTSRERLHLRQEQVYPISGLEYPDRGNLGDAAEWQEIHYTAAQLFLESARRIRPNFELTKGDLAHLTRICQLVGGMPLALELAAGWVELLPLAEIAAEIERGLGFLVTDLQDIPDRHRCMRAVFGSTWEQLEPMERKMMERLSVFRGGFAREAARQLATEREGMAITLQLLSRLVSKSLLQADQARERYQIHELLRQYAQERLEGSGELAATQTAHASYTLDMLHQRGAAAKGGRGQKEALDAIEADFSNIRAAWDWALKQGNLATIDQTLEALFWFSWIRSRELDGVELYLGAEAQFASDPDRYSNAAWRRIAARRIFLAMTASAWVSNHERLMEIEKILAMAQEDGDLAEIAFALFLQGLLQIQVSIPAALQSLKESQLLYHQLGETYYESQIMGEISFLHLATGFPEKRVEIARQQLELARKNEARLKWADAMGQIGFVAGMAGCYSEAEANYKEALPVFRELGDRFHISEYLIYLGELAFLAGDVTRARAWVTEGQALAMQFNIHSEQVRSQGVQSMILSAEEQYGQAADLCQDLMQYRDRLIPFAGFRGMAYALCGLGDFAAAKDHLNKALEMAAFMKAPGWQVQCLPAAALIAASEDRLERAIELLALAYHHPAGATGWLGKFSLVTRLRAHFEAKLSPEGLETAWEKGKGLDLGETVTALLEELG